MKSVLLAGGAPAQTDAWRDELVATGGWSVIGPAHTLVAARVLMHRQPPDLVVCGTWLGDGHVLDMVRVLRAGSSRLQTELVVIDVPPCVVQDAACSAWLDTLPGQLTELEPEPPKPPHHGPSDPGNERLLMEALQAGADNFLAPHAAQGRTLAALAADALVGGADIPGWMAKRMLEHFEPRDVSPDPLHAVDLLSDPLAMDPAERWLLRQLAAGRRLTDIARADGVRPRVLAAQVRELHRKMLWDQRADGLGLRVAAA